MSHNLKPCFYEAHRWIDENTPVYPGDPKFTKQSLSSVEKGDCCSLYHISMSNHLGTHMDFPAHFIKGGKTRSDYTLAELMGSCVVITLAHLKTAEIFPGDCVLFKNPDQTPLTLSDAEYLRSKQIRIVGTEAMSVDAQDAHDFPIHRLFLSNEILIVENLLLTSVPEGRYHVRICPLPLAHLDGAPITVTLECDRSMAS